MTARDQVITLEQGDYELELCPAFGGCITAFRHRGRDVLRPATDEYWQTREPRAAASFPLLPFSNRIADGRFEFEGTTYQFPINMPPEPHSIHGDGWRAAWRVELAEPARAVLAHAPADTPFPYASRQIFELAEDGLNATLEITNTGAGRVPMGFGHHPYFPRTEGLTLEMAAASVWMPDARKLPARKVAVPDAWNFASPTRLSPLDLDHDFTDRHGPILMHWPENRLRLAIDSDPLFAHTVVYVPPERDFVCVEPVSHLANAVNLAPVGVADTGLRILAPGETFSGSMRFRVTS